LSTSSWVCRLRSGPTPVGGTGSGLAGVGVSVGGSAGFSSSVGARRIRWASWTWLSPAAAGTALTLSPMRDAGHVDASATTASNAATTSSVPGRTRSRERGSLINKRGSLINTSG